MIYESKVWTYLLTLFLSSSGLLTLQLLTETEIKVKSMYLCHIFDVLHQMQSLYTGVQTDSAAILLLKHFLLF